MHRFFNTTVIILVTIALIAQPSTGIIDIFINALFGYLFGQLFENYLGPASRYVLGGPTVLVQDALKYATPLLHPFFGERFDNFMFSMLGGMVSAATTAIAFAIEGIARAIYEPIVKGVEKAIDISFMLFEVFTTKIEVAGALASIVNLFSREAPQGITDVISGLSKEVNLTEGRSLQGLPSVAGQSLQHQSRNFILNDPSLERFLYHFDEDNCLEQLLCTIRASHPMASTPEERKFMKNFDALTQSEETRRKPLSGLKKAADFGAQKKQVQMCEREYKCQYPLVFRTFFTFTLKRHQKIR